MTFETMPFTILLIEDDSIMREYLSTLLKEVSTNIITATDGLNGLDSLDKENIDLIITDLNMPRLNGMNFINKVRSIQGEKREIPIIIISGEDNLQTLHLSIEYNVQGYFLKPIDFTKLKNSINKIKEKFYHKELLKTSKHQLDSNIKHGEHELINALAKIPSAMVLLIKINEFKYLNLSLNSEFSKKLQKRFAKRLYTFIPKHLNFKNIYILEEGTFAFIKYHMQDNNEDLNQEIKDYQKRINHEKIKIGFIDYTLSIVSSLAYGKNAYENTKIGMSKILEAKQEFIIATNLLEEKQSDASKKLEKFNMIQEAIENYNILSYFQPIINNKTKQIEKYESLIRLIDNEKNILSPYHFLELAKEGKYYQKLTAIIFENSFRALFYTNLSISINLSSLDIEKKETRNIFIALLKKYKTDTHRIMIELLEDEKVKDTKIIQDFLKEIKKYGVKIAIDDFGVGFSNFSRVLDYQPDFIKIDGSLIKNIVHDDFSRHMIEAIVSFAKKQKIKTIAEYVENEAIFKTLCQLEVDYSQGYYFGKPEPLSI